MLISVIVITYNRPDALAAVLEGLLAQTDRDFEVVVADDGSTADTARRIAEYQAVARFALRHVWQEDRGFRAAAARNRALAACRGEYVAMLDGDCVPAADFVAAHRRLAEPGWFLSGNRVLLSRPFTEQALRERLPLHRWGAGRWLAARLAGRVNRLLPLLRLPDGGFRKRMPRRWEGVKTCNLSAWRSDLARVNGLDERYSGWGLEDSDLVVRLIRAGVGRKSARFAAPVFHLWHPEQDRSGLAENRRNLEAILHSDEIRAARGLGQYL